tara:strand:+ start:791 stop:1069 length:279 start_codon:yes stop_codon:yes gene_type:complete
MANPRYSKVANRRGAMGGGMMKRGMYKKGSFPDLNKDGKITKADILKGRGVFSSGSKNPNAIKSIKPTLGLKGKKQYLMDRINKKKIGTKKK